MWACAHSSFSVNNGEAPKSLQILHLLPFHFYNLGREMSPISHLVMVVTFNLYLNSVRETHSSPKAGGGGKQYKAVVWLTDNFV